MNTILRIGLIVVPSLLAGCSLISDFGDVSYTDVDGGDGDGDGDSGPPTGGTGGGDGGGTGGTGGGDGGGTGGTGGTAGDSGNPFECMPGDDGGCVDCEENSDCTTNVCVDGLCVQCASDGDCTDGVCKSNTCVDCLEDADCGDDFKCLVANNTCVPVRKPTGVWMSTAGGTTTSAAFSVRVFVLGVQPAGSTASTNYKVTLGPAAGRQ